MPPPRTPWSGRCRPCPSPAPRSPPRPSAAGCRARTSPTRRGRTAAADRHPWHRVLWLTGVDYFSTLGYQPGIALLAAGALSPDRDGACCRCDAAGRACRSTRQVARALLRRAGLDRDARDAAARLVGQAASCSCCSGFAATDFVITMTLSAADAAKHAVENPLLHPVLGRRTRSLLDAGPAVRCWRGVFLKGFTRGDRASRSLIAVPYLLLNLVVLLRGLRRDRPAHRAALAAGTRRLTLRGDWPTLLLALGDPVPQAGARTERLRDRRRGDAARAGAAGGRARRRSRRARSARRAGCCARAARDHERDARALELRDHAARSRPRPTRCTAARPAGARSPTWRTQLPRRRLRHASTTCHDPDPRGSPGASAMAGLLNLIPRYLPRFGMAPRWTAHRRPLVLCCSASACVVTLALPRRRRGAGRRLRHRRARADALGRVRRGAGPVARVRAPGRGCARAPSLAPERLLLADHGGLRVHAASTTSTDGRTGVIIASCFILAVLCWARSAAPPLDRAARLRRSGFADEQSARLWKEMVRHAR